MIFYDVPRKCFPCPTLFRWLLLTRMDAIVPFFLRADANTVFSLAAPATNSEYHSNHTYSVFQRYFDGRSARHGVAALLKAQNPDATGAPSKISSYWRRHHVRLRENDHVAALKRLWLHELQPFAVKSRLWPVPDTISEQSALHSLVHTKLSTVPRQQVTFGACGAGRTDRTTH